MLLAAVPYESVWGQPLSAGLTPDFLVLHNNLIGEREYVGVMARATCATRSHRSPCVHPRGGAERSTKGPLPGERTS